MPPKALTPFTPYYPTTNSAFANKSKRWDAAEDRELAAMVSAGRDTKSVAQSLRRTECAVASRIRSQGYSSSRPRSPFVPTANTPAAFSAPSSSSSSQAHPRHTVVNNNTTPHHRQSVHDHRHTNTSANDNDAGLYPTWNTVAQSGGGGSFPRTWWRQQQPAAAPLSSQLLSGGARSATTMGNSSSSLLETLETLALPMASSSHRQATAAPSSIAFNVSLSSGYTTTAAATSSSAAAAAAPTSTPNGPFTNHPPPLLNPRLGATAAVVVSRSSNTAASSVRPLLYTAVRHSSASDSSSSSSSAHQHHLDAGLRLTVPPLPTSIEAEGDALIAAFKDGVPLQHLAARYQRSEACIVATLEQRGIVDTDEAFIESQFGPGSVARCLSPSGRDPYSGSHTREWSREEKRRLTNFLPLLCVQPNASSTASSSPYPFALHILTTVFERSHYDIARAAIDLGVWDDKLTAARKRLRREGLNAVHDGGGSGRGSDGRAVAMTMAVVGAKRSREDPASTPTTAASSVSYCDLTLDSDAEYDEDMECDICMERDKNRIFVPCNHTCCGVCARMISICHICRGPIQSQKVYTGRK